MLHILATQSVVHGPTASASASGRHLLEIQNLMPHPDLLNQNPHLTMIPVHMKDAYDEHIFLKRNKQVSMGFLTAK